MTTREAMELVGRTGRLRTAEGLAVMVKVEDAREVWGRRDLLVVPFAGTGKAWVSAARVTLDSSEEE